jgi:hypothetical protein
MRTRSLTDPTRANGEPPEKGVKSLRARHFQFEGLRPSNSPHAHSRGPTIPAPFAWLTRCRSFRLNNPTSQPSSQRPPPRRRILLTGDIGQRAERQEADEEERPPEGCSGLRLRSTYPRPAVGADTRFLPDVAAADRTDLRHDTDSSGFYFHVPTRR